ncbi:hypothetical protein GmHk_17G049690 [Glycine max]|nr:hypothetical protein GmHk_17G049690 [Glycine max]
MHVSVLHCSSTKAIWNDLKERFEQHNGPLIFQLKCDLVSLQQGFMFVLSYYAKLRSIWESLLELKPAHSCPCDGIQPWCDYDRMEKTEIGTSASHETSHVFAVKNGFDSKNKGGQKDHPICAHCGIQGHTKAQCYKQNGYPPNYKKNKPSSNSANQVSSRSVNQVSLSSMSQDSPSQFQLTAQQYNQLMSLLQGQTSNVTVPHQNHGDSNGMIMSASSFNLLRDCWLVDSGASTHVACQ